MGMPRKAKISVEMTGVKPAGLDANVGTIAEGAGIAATLGENVADNIGISWERCP